MKTAAAALVPAVLIGLGLMVIGRGFLVPDPNWPERLQIGVVTAGLGFLPALHMVGTRIDAVRLRHRLLLNTVVAVGLAACAFAFTFVIRIGGSALL